MSRKNVVFGNPSGTKPCTVTVPVDFVFDCIGPEKEVIENIKGQIITDLNAYYQNDDDTAQLKKVLIYEHRVGEPDE